MIVMMQWGGDEWWWHCFRKCLLLEKEVRVRVGRGPGGTALQQCGNVPVGCKGAPLHWWWQKGGNRGDAESARPLINQNCRLTHGRGLFLKYHPNVATRSTLIASFHSWEHCRSTVFIFIHSEVWHTDIPILLRSALSHKAIPPPSSEKHLAQVEFPLCITCLSHHKLLIAYLMLIFLMLLLKDHSNVRNLF